MVVLLFVFFSLHTFAQDAAITPEKYTAHNKGKFYIYWGGNRGHFTKSDIRFRGDNYDFTLQDVKAHDKPKGYHVDYINPGRMTIPQTNFRIGYFISDKYNISLGIDHMKYVMSQNQTAKLNGTINIPGGNFNGNYTDYPQQLTEDFLTFEHTDGLNYVNIEIARVDDFTSLLFGWDTDKVQLNVTEGIGAGILYPKTNTMLLGKERYDEFHVAGYGVSAKAGLNITFFKHFFIQGELKGGYINMQDIRTTKSKSDKASQEFFFAETILTVGAIFRI